ncbi:hypothetical protein ACJIZ3_016747 [Penstemon smallii]|uniref:Uncharacterized protein n=1 Tax=Penstemon smallii TaxID=265156 RepID=A0ABD3STL1_9LAMI
MEENFRASRRTSSPGNLRLVGNCGAAVVPPISSTSATHAVSYGDTLISPSPIDFNIDLIVSTKITN